MCPYTCGTYVTSGTIKVQSKLPNIALQGGMRMF